MRNAGLVIERRFGEFDCDAFEREYAVNTLGPLRFGTTDEVAKLVWFFASGDSSYITGQDIAIDVGFTMAMRFESVDFNAP